MAEEAAAGGSGSRKMEDPLKKEKKPSSKVSPKKDTSKVDESLTKKLAQMEKIQAKRDEEINKEFSNFSNARANFQK